MIRVSDILPIKVGEGNIPVSAYIDTFYSAVSLCMQSDTNLTQMSQISTG